MMGSRVDFSGNAPVYDRRHGAVLATEVTRELAQLGDLRPGARILDVGAGTGRVGIAFARTGCQVLALDPASEMLQELRRKASDCTILTIAGEGARLPFDKGVFDGVVLARIAYLMSDWQTVLSEAFDVLRCGGALFHEWGNGTSDEAWVRIREKARKLFKADGVREPFHPGARSQREVDDFLTRLGLIRRNELRLGPGPDLTLRAFLERIESDELSYTWKVPAPIQQRCLPQLREWCESHFDLDVAAPIPREFGWTIYRKGDGVAC